MTGNFQEAESPDRLLLARHPWQTVRQRVTGRVPSSLPGPVGKPVVGVWPEFNRAPAAYVQRMAREYGDIFRLPMPKGDVVILNHPRYYEQVFIGDEESFAFTTPRMQKVAHFLSKMSGANVDPYRAAQVLAQQRRSNLVPLLARRSLAQVAGDFIDEFVTRVDRWNEFADSGTSIDIQHELGPISLAAFLRAMYTTEFSDDELWTIDDELRTVLGAFGIAFAPRRVTVDTFKGPGATWRMLRMAHRLIEKRVASGAEIDDLLGSVLKFTDVNGKPLSHAERVFTLMLVLTGGYDTIVAASGWMFGLLAQNPQAKERLFAEIDQLGGRTPTMADLKSLPWTKACFDEAQRLQGGPVHVMVAQRDVEIDGYHFVKGTTFGLGWQSMHLDPRWWPEPEKFDPLRFIDRGVVSARPRTAFVPFGFGKLSCPGQGVAYANATLLTAVIMQRYDVGGVPDDWRPQPRYRGSTPVLGGVPLILTRRNS